MGCSGAGSGVTQLACSDSNRMLLTSYIGEGAVARRGGWLNSRADGAHPVAKRGDDGRVASCIRCSTPRKQQRRWARPRPHIGNGTCAAHLDARVLPGACAFSTRQWWASHPREVRVSTCMRLICACVCACMRLVCVCVCVHGGIVVVCLFLLNVCNA